MKDKIKFTDTHLKHWVNEHTAHNPIVLEIEDGAELSKIVKKAKNTSLVVVVPCEPSEKWWQDVIGSHYPYVYIVKKNAKQFSNKAVVIFNPKYKLQEFPNSKEIVETLREKYGYPYSDLAEKIGKTRQVIYRLVDEPKTDLRLEQRWKHISILNDLLEEEIKGRKE